MRKERITVLLGFLLVWSFISIAQNQKDVSNTVRKIPNGSTQVNSIPQNVQSIKELRMVVPNSLGRYYLSEAGKTGFWSVDPIDKSTPDNGGTVIIAGGKRLKRDDPSPINVEWFGASANDLIDDTDEIRAAVNAAALKGNLVVFPEGSNNYRISGSILLKKGIAGLYMEAGTAIQPIGAGYTALVTENSFAWSTFKVTITGTGNTVNGIELKNPQRSSFEYIRVYNLNGFGLKVKRGWDNLFQNISVEECGNSTNYAFSFEDDGDTGNMTNFLRLQVELSNQKAIYISPNTLSCVFQNIHSERTKVSIVNSNTWVLGGIRCVYSAVRLNAMNSGNYKANKAVCLLSGAQLTITGLLVEGEIGVMANAFSPNGTILLENPEINGKMKKSGNGKTILTGGHLKRFEGDTGGMILQHAQVDEIDLGFSTNRETALNVHNCIVSNLSSTSKQGRIDAHNTMINAGSFAGAETYLTGSIFNTGTALIDYRRVLLINSQLRGNLTLDFGYLECLAGSKITGDLTVGPGRQVIFDASSVVTGSVTGYGPPQVSQYAGGFVAGQRTYNPKPQLGQPTSWICTADGTKGASGIWIVEAKL